MHKTAFVEKGVRYTSVEQYFQVQKCIYTNNNRMKNIILKQTDPIICNKLGRLIYMDEYHNFGIRDTLNIYKQGYILKFNQNEKCSQFLLKTKGEIAYADCNIFFGIGIEIIDPRINSSKLWRGLNMLGVILQNIRDEIICNE